MSALAVLVVTGACGGGGGAVERHARADLQARLAEDDSSGTVRGLYEDRDPELIWVSADGLTRQGKRVVQAISGSVRDGLDASQYGVADAIEALGMAGQEDLSARERGEALASAELALTRGFIDLLRDLRRGASRPSNVQPAWRIAHADTMADSVLVRAIREERPEELVAGARPAAGEYARLTELLERLGEIRDAGGWARVPEHRLEPGDDHEAVAALRERLAHSVVEAERNAARKGADRASYYDEDLERAVRSFQERHLLETDGIVAGRTVEALNTPVEDRMHVVELNMERWRWMPHELGGRAILVNVAGYDVQLMDDDHTVLAMKAVVGKPEWRTPLFADTMTHMIVHPYWNVPESILTEELLPSLRDDAGYLEAHNYEVVDADGRLVDGDIDLDELDPELDGALRVRQKPGAGNALGQVKFMFPNNSAVYLHDTPAKSFFERTSRALSHGCIRVEKPIELAHFLLEWTGGNTDELDEALASDGENARIDLPHAIPVYLSYLTVRVDEDGTPRFLEDPYLLDREMGDLLLATPSSRLAVVTRHSPIGGD